MLVIAVVASQKTCDSTYSTFIIELNVVDVQSNFAIGRRSKHTNVMKISLGPGTHSAFGKNVVYIKAI